MFEFECLTQETALVATSSCNPSECYPGDCDCKPGNDSWCRPELGDECAP